MSDALDNKHPTFEDVGAVHLRLTIPVPSTTTIRGFEHKTISDKGEPNPDERIAEATGPGGRPESQPVYTGGNGMEEVLFDSDQKRPPQCSDEEDDLLLKRVEAIMAGLSDDPNTEKDLLGCKALCAKFRSGKDVVIEEPAAPAPLKRTRTVDRNRVPLQRDSFLLGNDNSDDDLPPLASSDEEEDLPRPLDTDEESSTDDDDMAPFNPYRACPRSCRPNTSFRVPLYKPKTAKAALEKAAAASPKPKAPTTPLGAMGESLNARLAKEKLKDNELIMDIPDDVSFTSDSVREWLTGYGIEVDKVVILTNANGTVTGKVFVSFKSHLDAFKALAAPRMLPNVRKQTKGGFENFCCWLDFGKTRGFVDTVIQVANPCGARDLYVLDVILPTEVLTSCMETADSLIGDEKPAKNLHLQKVLRNLKKSVSDQVDQPTINYLETATILVVMSLLLDLGETGKNHCHVFAYSGNQPMFKDFFANFKLEEAMEELDNAKKEAGHPVEGIVLAVPAPEINGTLNEKIVMYETAAFGEYELTEKKPVVGAVQVGVDLMGKASPNDPTNPINYIGAVYRHFGDTEAVVAEGTPYEYVIHLDRSEKSKLSEIHSRVWDDMIEDHCEDFRKLLECPQQRFDYDFHIDGKPNSYSFESYERWLEEQIADERFFSADNALTDLLRNTKATQEHMQNIKASSACKKGEDSSRSRYVITPGVAGSEGLHQARTSPMIKALEALHSILYNHTNLKGLTEDTKRIRFADFLRAVAKGAIVFGTDKKANDSCFREAVWKKCVTYLARMNDIFEEIVVTRAYVFTPNEATAKESFPKGTLDMKYWIMKLTPALSILLSGIGPTSFFNRLESTVENGSTVLGLHGEAAYQKWRVAERRALASVHPAWRNHPAPHVSEIVEWEPLAPQMVTDTSIKYDKLEEGQIISYHMGINEGDDQSHAVIPPNNDEWNDLSVKDVVMKYTATMSMYTGFIFEAALTTDELDMVGRNSVFEMLSAWIALPTGRADAYEVAIIVPKVLKAIRKLPHCTISSQHTLKYDKETGEPYDVERDHKFWSLALTKFFALAIINKESLGVRGLFLSHGDYCYQQLERLIGSNGAYYHETMYGDRDPEKRQIEEAASTTFAYCGFMRDHTHEVLANVKLERVVRTCCAAWRSELPQLATEPKERVIAGLLAFDSISLSLEITDQHISDPMLLWQSLDIGCLLDPLVAHATSNHKKVATMFRSSKLLADSEETVLLARKLACTKPNGSADKDSRPDTAADSQLGGKGKGKKGKGKSMITEMKRISEMQPGQSDSKKGKGQATSVHKGNGKGKSMISEMQRISAMQRPSDSSKAELEARAAQAKKTPPTPKWNKSSSKYAASSSWTAKAAERSGAW